MKHTYRTNADAQRVRAQACEMAAVVAASRPDEDMMPLLWQAALFFESYITMGHAATQRDFGPKAAVQLRVVGQ